MLVFIGRLVKWEKATFKLLMMKLTSGVDPTKHFFFANKEFLRFSLELSSQLEVTAIIVKLGLIQMN